MTYAAMKLALFMAGPILLVTLLIGLIISIFQAATQVNDQKWNKNSEANLEGRFQFTRDESRNQGAQRNIIR